MLGVVVGSLTRNPTTAMVVIFGVWIAEKIAGGWLGDAGHYLPFTLVESTLGLHQADGVGLRRARADRRHRRAGPRRPAA